MGNEEILKVGSGPLPDPDVDFGGPQAEAHPEVAWDVHYGVGGNGIRDFSKFPEVLHHPLGHMGVFQLDVNDLRGLMAVLSDVQCRRFEP